jgi:hypothetical protein
MISIVIISTVCVVIGYWLFKAYTNRFSIQLALLDVEKASIKAQFQLIKCNHLGE